MKEKKQQRINCNDHLKHKLFSVKMPIKKKKKKNSINDVNITLLFKIYIEDVHKDTVHSVILKLYSGDASHMNCGFESGSARPY